MQKTNTNPRKIPRSQADVDKAYRQGQEDALRGALSIMLFTLQNTFQADDERLKKFADEFNYTLDSLNRGYITGKDLEGVLKEEYGTTIVIK